MRVYSAVLDFGRFGETSTEISGIFTTANKATASVSRTAAPTTFTIGGTAVTLSKTESEMQTVTIAKNTDVEVVATGSSGNHIYVNGVYGTGSVTNTFRLGSNKTQIIRVIVQDGTSSLPYIGYARIKTNR